jgi:transcriptional regulator with XRE-family HTH domain
VIEVEVRHRTAGTPGGTRLRALRMRAGKTQLWVETEAELGSGYLQRIECGRVAQPGRATVERILAALDARHSERREVLERFGYTVAAPPPSDDDIAWACAVSRRELHEVAFPSYVLDCTHRLLAWNGYVPHLFGITPADPSLGGLAGRSILAPWFDPASPLARLVAEPEQFLPALVRAFRYEMQQFSTEPWYATVFTELWDLPRFRRTWRRVEREPSPAGATRALVPVRLVLPDTGALQFRLSSERFTRDTRFRLIYFFPADPATIHWCAALTTGSNAMQAGG